jgi:four helix bundle protein
MRLEDLQVYQLSMSLGDRIWDIVIHWDYFAKDTVGKQLVKAADSVASNISEGFGRFHYKESKNFGYYARGSLYETKTWITKAYNRSLINDSDFNNFEEDIKVLGIKLNNYIRSIGQKK